MIWLLFACTTTSVEKQHSVIDQTQEAPEDTGFIVELETEEETVSIEAIEETLQQGIEEIRTVRASRALDAYDALLAEGDEGCPRWYTGGDGPYWADECTADSGVSFSGYGILFEHTGTQDEWGNSWTGRQIHCEGGLQSADTGLTCVGGFNELVGVDAEENPVFYSYTSPYVLVEDGVEFTYPLMEMWATNNSWGKAINYSGMIAVDSGLVQFDEMSINNVECSLEPSGKQNVQVTAESTSWVNIIWHGDQGGESEACDGCADAFMNGKAIGSVCADFSVWLSWEASPYE